MFSVTPVFASVAKFSTSNIKPWGFLTSDNKPSGLLVHLTDALQQELRTEEVVIDNQLRPYPRVIYEIRNGDVDFAVMFKSPSANEIAVSIGKVVDARVLIIGSAERDKIASLNELDGKVVGYIRGSKYGVEFDNNQRMKKLSVASMKQGIDMLLKGRIYALASAEQTLYYAMHKMDIPRENITTMYTVSSVQADLYFSKASLNTHLKVPVQAALGRLKAKGILDQIFEQAEGFKGTSN